MHCARHLRLCPRHHRDRSTRNRGRNEILAVDFCALKRAEDGPRCNLAVIDGKAGYSRVTASCDTQPGALGEGSEHHSPPPLPTNGERSDMSMSRVSSGMMPSSGPIRVTTRPTIGAVLNAAVR